MIICYVPDTVHMKHTFDLCAWWTIFSLSERKKKSCLFTKIILNLRFKLIKVRLKGFPGGDSGKGSTNEGDTRDEGSISGSGRSPGEGNDTPSSILAWKIPQTAGPGGLQPMGSQSQTQVSAHTQSEMRCVVSWGSGSVVKNLLASAGDKGHGFNPWVRKIPGRRKWQPTPVFLLKEIPWTEKPDGLQLVGSQRVGHD